MSKKATILGYAKHVVCSAYVLALGILPLAAHAQTPAPVVGYLELMPQIGGVGGDFVPEATVSEPVREVLSAINARSSAFCATELEGQATSLRLIHTIADPARTIRPGIVLPSAGGTRFYVSSATLCALLRRSEYLNPRGPSSTMWLTTAVGNNPALPSHMRLRLYVSIDQSTSALRLPGGVRKAITYLGSDLVKFAGGRWVVVPSTAFSTRVSAQAAAMIVSANAASNLVARATVPLQAVRYTN